MNYFNKMLAACLAVLAPIQTVIIITGVLIFFDWITGMLAAKKRNEAITSAQMRRSISKMVIYQIAIITGFLVENYMIGGAIPISKLVSAAIGMVEVVSILENVNTVNGQNIFTDILKKLGSKNEQK